MLPDTRVRFHEMNRPNKIGYTRLEMICFGNMAMDLGGLKPHMTASNECDTSY